MSSNFCPAPFVHLYHRGSPEGKICCLAKGKLIHSISAKDTWSSVKYKNIRQDLLDNKPISECKPCYDLEKLGAKSDRLYYLHKFENSKFNIHTGNNISKPIDLDLRLSNLCNLGCRMCGPHFSSVLEKDASKLPELAKRYAWESQSPNTMLSDEDIDWLINNNPNLRRIKFLGGEPTIMNEMYKILDMVIENKQQPIIAITTNCTNVNKRFIEYLKYFKESTINLSIDGFGPTLEYIRHPAHFDTIEKNANIISELATDVNINFVIQAYNIENLNDFIDWVSKNKKIYNVHSVIVHTPRGTSPLYLPIDYRKPLLEKALNNKNINKRRFIKLKKQLTYLYNSTEVLAFNDFLNLTLIFDEHRNQHLFKVTPKLKSYVIDHIKNIGKSSRLKPRLIKHFIEKNY
tara:strand:+ start:2562 stop:3773 length:1212 start_codon:yes stop_codon:yes gene_type:complete